MKPLPKILKHSLIGIAVLGIGTWATACIALTNKCGFAKYGPYHQPALVHRVSPFEVHTVDKTNEGFYCLNGAIYCLFAGKIKRYTYEKYIWNISEDNGRIYAIRSQDIALLDENEAEKASYPITADFVFNGYAYRRVREHGNRLIRFELATARQDSTYALAFESRTFINIDGQRFFVADDNKFIKTGEGFAFQLNYVENGEYKNVLFWDGGCISFNAEKNIRLLSSVSEGSLYVSITEPMHHEDCAAWKSYGYPLACICDFGTSDIFRIDLLTGSQTKVYEAPPGSVPIRAESGLVAYYEDGFIYENGRQVCSIEKIQTGDSYYEYGEDHVHADTVQFFHRLMFSQGYYYDIVNG